MINIENKRMVLLIVLSLCFIFAADPHPLRQMVEDWPAGYDITGAKYFVYDIDQLCDSEIDVLTEISVGSFINYSSSTNRARWNVNLGNFPNPPGHSWHGGDTVIAFGSWDSVAARDPVGYPDNPNHTGFYWLFSDTIIHDAGVEETWTPADTLRPLPKPIATQVGGPTGNINISISNPAETRRVDQTVYDVMGYWICADTTGSGTPSRFDKEVGFFPVSGGPDDITVCVDPVSNYHDGHTVYWAYKLVARPDTVDAPGETMGYSTYYFSQNSDPIVIIGIEETARRSAPDALRLLKVYPNPFSKLTNISFGIGQGAESIELKIYDATGRMVRQWDYPTMRLSDRVIWYGTDQNDRKVPVGVYFVRLATSEQSFIKEVILLR